MAFASPGSVKITPRRRNPHAWRPDTPRLANHFSRLYDHTSLSAAYRRPFASLIQRASTSEYQQRQIASLGALFCRTGYGFYYSRTCADTAIESLPRLSGLLAFRCALHAVDIQQHRQLHFCKLAEVKRP